MNFKNLCAGIFVTFLVFGAGAQELNSILSEEICAELKTKGSIVRDLISDKEDFVFTLTPDTPLFKKALNAWVEQEKPVFTSEQLYYISKEELKEKSKNKEVSNPSFENLPVILRSTTKMKGMQYYSNTKKKWTTLYKDAYMIKGPDDHTPVPDVTEGSADGNKLYCLLDDNSFGNCVFSLEYFQSKDEIAVCFTNVEPMKLAVLTGVKKNNLKMNLIVKETGDHFLIYLVAQAKYPLIGVLENTLKKSFDARIDAIYNWFTYQF